MTGKKKCVALVLALSLAAGLSGCGNSQEKAYESAKNLYFYGQYLEARRAYQALGDYSDAQAMVTACDYQLAMGLLADGEYLGAASAFEDLEGYGNARGLARAAAQLAALQQYEYGDRDGALEALDGLSIARDLLDLTQETDLTDFVGKWSLTLDASRNFTQGLQTLAQEQDKLDKEFAKSIPITGLTALVELQIDSDGLAVLNLTQEDLDRLSKSYATQLHQGLVEYYEGVIGDMAEEWEVSYQQMLDNYSVKDCEGFFEVEEKLSMKDFEKRLSCTQTLAELSQTYQGAGVAIPGEDSAQLRFPEKTWKMERTGENKLTLTSGETVLEFTRLS